MVQNPNITLNLLSFLETFYEGEGVEGGGEAPATESKRKKEYKNTILSIHSHQLAH